MGFFNASLIFSAHNLTSPDLEKSLRLQFEKKNHVSKFTAMLDEEEEKSETREPSVREF